MKPFAVIWYDDDSTMHVLPERFERHEEAWDFIDKLYTKDEAQIVEYFVCDELYAKI